MEAVSFVAPAAFTMMLKFCVAAGVTPLLAVTVPVKVPFAVGVPLSRPPLVSVVPFGSAPAVRLNVGAGEPLAVYWKLYAVPFVAGEGGGPLVNAGAWLMVIEKF